MRSRIAFSNYQDNYPVAMKVNLLHKTEITVIAGEAEEEPDAASGDPPSDQEKMKWKEMLIKVKRALIINRNRNRNGTINLCCRMKEHLSCPSRMLKNGLFIYTFENQNQGEETEE